MPARFASVVLAQQVPNPATEILHEHTACLCNRDTIGQVIIPDRKINGKCGIKFLCAFVRSREKRLWISASGTRLPTVNFDLVDLGFSSSLYL